MRKRQEKQSQSQSKLGLFSDTVKKDYEGASNFNRGAFAVGAAGFVAGTILFICSCACGLGAIAALIGFAVALAGALIASLIAYKNHKDVNKPAVSFAQRLSTFVGGR